MTDERLILTTVQLSELLGIAPSSIAYHHRSGRIAPVLTTADGDVLWDSDAVRRVLDRPRKEWGRPDPNRPNVRLFRPLLEADAKRPRPTKPGPPRGIYRGHRRPDPQADEEFRAEEERRAEEE